ncbi:MAG: SulP family inorganic anion transporter [Janthinobacterium lividum]
MRDSIGRDVSASFVVFLVAMPLCMGIAMASGLPPERGLLTGIIGGIVTGLLSGSPLGVSGPAAGLVVMVFAMVQQYGAAALAPILLLAGALQCLAGVLRLGRWFRAISPAVVHGMLAGIGLLIVAGQLHVMVDRKPGANGVENLLAAPAAFLDVLTPAGHGGAAALLVALATIAVMLGWERLRPRALRLVPGALLGVLAGMALAAGFGLPVLHVSVPANFLDAVSLPALGSLARMAEPALIVTAISLAFVASAESLLSASAVDQMQDRVRTDYDRELIAQGVGNATCGLLGGLPLTGVIVRSSANVQAGAVTRLSTVLHGVIILLFVVLLPGVLSLVPTATLAGVLVVTGWRLIGLHHVRELLHRHGKAPVAIWAATVLGVVGVDLLSGVVIGIGLSLAESARHFRRPALRMRRLDAPASTELHLAGTATFLQLPRLISAVEAVPAAHALRVRTRGLRHMDHTFASTLRDLVARRGGVVLS